MPKMVFMSEVYGDAKDGSEYEASLDIACKSNLPAAKAKAQRRADHILGRGYCARLRCANVYSFDGQSVKGYQFQYDRDEWSDPNAPDWKSIEPTRDIVARVKALSASRGLGSIVNA